MHYGDPQLLWGHVLMKPLSFSGDDASWYVHTSPYAVGTGETCEWPTAYICGQSWSQLQTASIEQAEKSVSVLIY